MRSRKECLEGYLSPKDALFSLENTFHAEGFTHIAGVDEAGRGALVGPVVAAAVILPSHIGIPAVFDSKQIAEEDRDILRDRILNIPGLRYAVGEASAAEIDAMNILQATFLAMRRAVEQLSADLVLVDGNRRPPGLKCAVRTVVKGDAKSASIAAASLLAKTRRDELMRTYAETYPQYGFKEHKGYGTAEHLEALQRYGATPEHRKTFAPVAAVLSPFEQVTLF